MSRLREALHTNLSMASEIQLPQGGSAIYTGIPNETITAIAEAENYVTTILDVLTE